MMRCDRTTRRVPFAGRGEVWRVAPDAGALPEAQVLAMFDADPQGCVLAEAVREDGRIVDFRLIYINEAGCRQLARPREELIGQRYRRLWPETVHDGTLPLYRTVVETGRPVTRTVYYDRETVAGHFEIWIGPYRDGFAARFVDLRQVTVAPASAGGSRLYDMLDAAFDGFTLLRAVRDPATAEIADFTCEYVNQLGAKLTGRTVADTIGMPLSVIAPDSWDGGLFDRYRAVAETGEPWRQQLAYPDVAQVWEVKIGRAGRDFVAISFREVTEQVEQQERLARSVTRAEQAAARATALRSVTDALVAASTTAQVYAGIGAVLRPSAGGQGLAVLLCHDTGLRLQFHAGYEPDVVERLRQVPPDHPYPATEVARTGRARYVVSVAEFDAAQPDPAAAIPRGGRQAWAFLPLTAAGETLGTLVVGYTDPRKFDDDDRATLQALAGLSAQALQRALLFEARTSLAGALQHALLPTVLPRSPGLRRAARYLPWTQGVDVGGDWYDIIAVRAGVVAVVIGDVAGHNATAAATMGQVRNAIRAYATEQHRPADVLHHTNQLLRAMHVDTMVTCCYLELHVARGVATAAVAGHPPPVVRTPDGAAHLLSVRHGVALGVADEVTYAETAFPMPPGTNVLLYTDGLIEDRHHPIDQGMRELCAAVGAAPTDDPDAILDHILAAEVGPHPRTDDVALICVTNDGLPGPA
jgi:serine phosphatase RsbU (regulator of sigma subunit)/PAS domain-containing protein